MCSYYTNSWPPQAMGEVYLTESTINHVDQEMDGGLSMASRGRHDSNISTGELSCSSTNTYASTFPSTPMSRESSSSTNYEMRSDFDTPMEQSTEQSLQAYQQPAQASSSSPYEMYNNFNTSMEQGMGQSLRAYQQPAPASSSATDETYNDFDRPMEQSMGQSFQPYQQPALASSSTTTYETYNDLDTPMEQGIGQLLQTYQQPAPASLSTPYARYNDLDTSIEKSIRQQLQTHQRSTRASSQARTIKSTPRSLRWAEPSEWLKSYKFVVRNNGKERFFELLPDQKITPLKPKRVDLDEEQNPCKGEFKCMYPGGCTRKKNGFGRPADLDRHYQNVHADDDQKKKYFCDRTKCPRAGDAFTRKDHYREHLRSYHKEDLMCAKRTQKGAQTKTDAKSKAEQAQWQEERVISPYCWRCSKCLIRVYVKKNGWDCPTCGNSCEEHRIEARVMMASDSTSYPCCSACNGASMMVDGFGAWIDCPACHPGILL